VSEDAVRRFTTIWTFYVAIGFLMGAVWLIRRVGLDQTDLETKFERELVVMTGFTAVFGAWVAIFTSARRAEIFGATAAYAAVLIVFVGTNPSASS
jgi:Ca2+/Na+ antiporter